MNKVFLATILALLLVGAAYADCDHLSGKTYALQIEAGMAELVFTQGPFGPGCAGKAVLTIDGEEYGTYSYRQQADGIVEVSGLGNFYYADGQLIWIQEGLIVLTVK